MRIARVITLIMLLVSQVFLLMSIHHNRKIREREAKSQVLLLMSIQHNRKIRECEAKAGEISGPDYQEHYLARMKCYAE